MKEPEIKKDKGTESVEDLDVRSKHAQDIQAGASNDQVLDFSALFDHTQGASVKR